MPSYLNKIESPQDVKKLSIDELNILATEIRQTLIERIMYLILQKINLCLMYHINVIHIKF